MPRLLLALLFSTSLFGQVLDTTPLRSRHDVITYRRLLNRLDQMRVTVDWDDLTLRDAVADLRRQLRLNFIVSRKLGDAAGDAVKVKLRDVPASAVLGLLADPERVVFQNRRGIIVVTSPDDAVRRAAVLRIYDVREMFYVPPDFPAPRIGINPGRPGEAVEEEPPEREATDPEYVVELIRQATGGDRTWGREGVSIAVRSGKLVVRHRPQVQRRVRRLIRLLVGTL